MTSEVNTFYFCNTKAVPKSCHTFWGYFLHERIAYPLTGKLGIKKLKFAKLYVFEKGLNMGGIHGTSHVNYANSW